MPPEFLSRAADSAKSKLLPQRGLKGRLRREVKACFDYFDENRHGGPISSLHANELTIEKIKGGYRVAIEIFRAPGHKDSITIQGRRVTVQQISPVETLPRQSLPRKEVDRIISRIQNVTVPYRESVEARKERRIKVKNLFDRIKDFRGRFPARGDGGTSALSGS